MFYLARGQEPEGPRLCCYVLRDPDLDEKVKALRVISQYRLSKSFREETFFVVFLCALQKKM